MVYLAYAHYAVSERILTPLAIGNGLYSKLSIRWERVNQQYPLGKG